MREVMIVAVSRLYRKPLIVAFAFLVAGALMTGGGFMLAESTGEMGFFALVAFGVLALIVAAVVYLMYRRLEEEFDKALRGKPVLRFTVENSVLADSIERNVRDLKADNKAKLLIMLAFCALFAIVLPFFFEDGYLFILICLGIAGFLTLSALIITAYRVRKLRKGSNEFILSPGGAYAGGEFHAWNMPGTRLTGVQYRSPEGAAPGLIEIEYTADSYPVSASQKVSIPIPGDQAAQTEEIVRALERSQRG